MSPAVEFPKGSKDVADSYRDEYPDYICPDDDRRLLTVTFTSDVPDDVIEQARRDAADARGELEDKAGQVGVADHEKEEIDFSRGRASIPHARAVKGIAASEGVDDWLAHYDPTLTVDEHRGVMKRAAREGRGGRQMDSADSAAERAGEAARTAESEECDHAAGHCANGDPEACEYIEERCGMDPDEILRRREPERPDRPDQPDPDGEEITGEAAGALQRSWGGYQAAVSQLVDALEQVRETWGDAQKAAKAINSIRRSHGQDPLHFEKLEAAQAEQMDLLRHMAADCHECHADHSNHDHEVSVSPVEDIRVTVTDSPAETPVGISDNTREAVQEAADDLTTDVDRSQLPDEIAPGVELDRTENPPPTWVYAADSDIPGVDQMELAIMDKGDQWYVYVGPDGEKNPKGSYRRKDDALQRARTLMNDTTGSDAGSTNETSDQFADEQQGTLNVGVDADEVAEEKQVTLTGQDATEANRALPNAWNRIDSGSVTRWVAGPYEIEAKPAEGRVMLWGPDDLSYTVGTGIPADAVDEIGQRFAAAVSPPDVDFSSSSSVLGEAAAQAKKDALDANTGLQQYA